MLQFKNEVVVESKEEQADVEDYLEEEDMDHITLGDDRESHCRMVF